MLQTIDIYLLIHRFSNPHFDKASLFKTMLRGGTTHPEFIIKDNTIETSFNFLIGPYGLMPEKYTEYLLNTTKKSLIGYLNFYDIFNNKFLRLFYLGWKKSQLAQLAQDKGNNFFDVFLERKFFYYANLYFFKLRSKQALKQLISSYYEINCSEVKADSLTIKLKIHQLSLLGVNSFLGRNLRLGSLIKIPSQKLIFCFENNSQHEYNTFTSNPCFLASLSRLVRSYLLSKVVFKFQFTIKPNGQNPCNYKNANLHYLGWNSWLGKSRQNTQVITEILPF